MKHRWVRYETPVMVCVAIDDNGDTRVVNVVVGEEDQDINLAHSSQGHPLVYDERMELLDPADHTVKQALSEAEDRDWPEPAEWDGGPDPLRYPGLYDPVDDEDEADDGEDLDPLDLDDEQPAHHGA